METAVPWQNFAYLAMAIPSLPLYLAVLFVIARKRLARKRYTTTFYALLLSLGLADLFSQATGTFTNIIRTSNICNSFYWVNRAWIAPMSYNCVTYSISLRLFGATLIAVQRYIVVCWSSNTWAEVGQLDSIKQYQKFTRIPFYHVLWLHWLPPLLYLLPIMTNFEKTLMGPNDMRLSLSNELSNQGTFMQNVWVLITFLISAFCYSKIFLLIVRHKVIANSGLSKEMRLSIVAFGQAISFATMFGFYTMCYIMAAIKSPYQQAVRPYMTILTGLISYWNPFVYVFLNGELKNDRISSTVQSQTLRRSA